MVAASRQWLNIRRTVQTALGNSITVDGRAVPIYHDDANADPDARAKQGVGAVPAWVETTFLTQLAGRRGAALWQVDCYSRIGGEGGATSDPFGLYVEQMADAVIATFSGLDASGQFKGKLFVKDYANPQAPTTTGMCLMLQNSAGDVGEPNDRKRLSFSDDYRRVSITLRFRTIQDATGSAAFYTA